MFSALVSVKRLCLFSLAISFLTTTLLVGFPHYGDSYNLRQPDGTLVSVKVWGDEFYQKVESIDGYTLIRNSDNWISYATVSTDRSEFVATDVVYTGQTYNSLRHKTPLTKGIDILPQYRRQKRSSLVSHLSKNKKSPIIKTKNIRKNLQEKVKGLTILIEFNDCKSDIPVKELDGYLNQEKDYKGFNNNGSVREYFLDVSEKKLDYTNDVYGPYVAKKNKTYYDDTAWVGEKAQELITETLQHMKDQGYDFSKLTTGLSLTPAGDTIEYVLAVNIFYAGFPENGWAKGLWPHSWQIQDTFKVGDVWLLPYQMTNIGTELNLGTFCHENGHMILNLPDLYDYDYDSKGVGRYGLMCSGTQKNPVSICSPLRALIGWENLKDITDATVGKQCFIQSNTNTSYIYKHPTDMDQMFLIEARKKEGRHFQLPDFGLLIWHVDFKMMNLAFNNQYNQMAKDSHYIVSLEQADGQYAMEKNLDYGGIGDCFYKGGLNKFNGLTVPNSYWWDNSSSGLSISNISEQRDEMYFSIGELPLEITYPESGDTLFFEDKINIRWISRGTFPQVKLEFSSDGGANYLLIQDKVANTGLFSWNVPNTTSKSCKIKISTADSSGMIVFETSRFTIVHDVSLKLNPNNLVKANIKLGANGTAKVVIKNDGKGTLQYFAASRNRSRNILINELYPCAPAKLYDGLELWNNGPDQNMTGWKLSWVDNGGTSGTYHFSDGFIFKSGKFLVFKDFEDADNDSIKYIGRNLYWSHTDVSNGIFHLAVTLTTNYSECVDFVKSIASPVVPPNGTEWVGQGIDFKKDFIYRKRNADTNKPADWSQDSSGTIAALNPAQNHDDVYKPWIELKYAAEEVQPSKTKELEITFSTSNLKLGSYFDIIQFTHNDRKLPNPFALACSVNIVPVTGIQKIDKLVNDGFFAAAPSPATEMVYFSFNKKSVISASIAIYDALGSLLTVLNNDEINQWDLINKRGSKVATGAYTAVLTAQFPNGEVKEYTTNFGVKE